MAEQYGTKPKKFTAAWWEYFWMYYKWHTLITLFIVVMAAYSLYGMLTAEKYDITVTFAGCASFTEESREEIETLLSPYCEDTDENGEKSLLFSTHNTSDAQFGSEYFSAIVTKLYVEFSDSDTYAFILSKDLAEYFAGEKEDMCVFEPLDQWFDGETSESAVFSAHGKKYGIAVSSLDIFKNTNIDMSDHYLLVRSLPSGKENSRPPKAYTATKLLLDKIIHDTK